MDRHMRMLVFDVASCQGAAVTLAKERTTTPEDKYIVSPELGRMGSNPTS